MVLAAIARAERHRETPGRAVVAQHLGLMPGATTTKRLKPIIHKLIEDGTIERTSAHGYNGWALTPLGRRRSRRALHTSTITLPEAPQHRRWRTAFAQASSQLGEREEALRKALLDAHSVLGQKHAPSSDWLSLAERLQTHALALACIEHCLNEWPEPADSGPDQSHPAGHELDYPLRRWLDASRATP